VSCHETVVDFAHKFDNFKFILLQSGFFGNFPQSGFFGGFSFFHMSFGEYVINVAFHISSLQEKNVYLVVVFSIDNAARTFFKDSIHSGG
jgi:hypothetical protein